MAGAEEVKNFEFKDLTSHRLGIRVCGSDIHNRDDDQMEVVIEKNQVYPCEGQVTKKTARDNQDNFCLEIIQGENDYAMYDHKLYSTVIQGIPRGP